MESRMWVSGLVAACRLVYSVSDQHLVGLLSGRFEELSAATWGGTRRCGPYHSGRLGYDPALAEHLPLRWGPRRNFF